MHLKSGLLFLFFVGVLSGAPEIAVPAVDKALIVDGRPDEASWKEAAILPLGQQEADMPSGVAGDLRALVKGGYLCLSARLPEAGRVVARTIGDGPALWRESTSSLWWQSPVSWHEDLIRWNLRFLSADSRAVRMVLAVNPLGAKFIETTGNQSGTGKEVLVAASIGRGEWSVEAAIPLDLLGSAGLISAERVRPPRPDAPELRWSWPAPNTLLEWRLPHGSFGTDPFKPVAEPEKTEPTSQPEFDMPHRVWTDAQRRMLAIDSMVERNIRNRVTARVAAEKQAWEQVDSIDGWTRFRDKRLAALRASLGPFPERTPLRAEVTRRLNFGDGFVVENVLYESRPGLVVTGNLYLPEKITARIPAIVVVHSHHAPRFQVELQDMGMTWARAGTAVLVIDQPGAGERVESQFWPRESYYSRYAMGMQLQLAGESLAKWMVWDLRRGIDMLLERSYIDPARVVLLGSVAGGGDPAALAAALDERVAAVIPFNFGEAGPEEHYTEGPRPYGFEFADPGWGSWETSRNLSESISGQFFPWFICASVAPRRFVYAFEIDWPHGVENEPAWARYRKVFEWYGEPDHLAEVHGYGPFPGPGEVTNIGANLRKKLYPILSRWLGIASPEVEYHKPRTYIDLAALTIEAARARRPLTISEAALHIARGRLTAALAGRAALAPEARAIKLRRELQKRLGDIEPDGGARATLVWSRKVDRRIVEAIGIEVEPGIHVPLLLLKPKNIAGSLPVALGFAQGGKEGFLIHRRREIEMLLGAGIAVCLADVRGVGETAWTQNRGPGSMSLAGTEFMLGETMLGARLKDARTIYRYLAERSDMDPNRIAVWGDSFVRTNEPSKLLDQSLVQRPGPWPIHQAEPLGALLAELTALFEGGVKAVAAMGGLQSYLSVLQDRFTYIPMDIIVPGILEIGDIPDVLDVISPRPVYAGQTVDGRNCLSDVPARAAEPVSRWLVRQLSR